MFEASECKTAVPLLVALSFLYFTSLKEGKDSRKCCSNPDNGMLYNDAKTYSAQLYAAILVGKTL